MLQISKLKINLHFITPAKLPYWMSSAFRGVFGREIRRIVCTNLNKKCDDCNNKEDCLFYYAYEKNISKRGYSPPLRPIIIVPPFFGKELNIEKDGTINLELIFFGDFKKYLPHTFLSLRLAGQEGLGAERHYGINKFEIENAVCCFSGKQIYDGNLINLTNLETKDIKDFLPLELNSNTIRIGFKTPLSSDRFPLTIEELLNGIRNRVIRLVNEYGNQEKIPEFSVKAEIKSYTKHFHRLQRRSSRSDKKEFRGYTGVIEYEFMEQDKNAKWLLNIGLVIGCGADISFGMGFLQKLK